MNPIHRIIWPGSIALLSTALVRSAAQAVKAATPASYAATADAVLDEVIVTATKRSERLLDVPISVSALTA